MGRVILPPVPKPDAIQCEVAEETIALACKLLAPPLTVVLPRDVTSDKRFKFVFRVRMACYKVLYEFYPRYGRVATWLHHERTSVMNGVKRAEKMIAADPEYAAKIEQLRMFIRRRELELRSAAVAAAFAGRDVSRAAAAPAPHECHELA
jgi:hypothetical protein